MVVICCHFLNNNFVEHTKWLSWGFFFWAFFSITRDCIVMYRTVKKSNFTLISSHLIGNLMTTVNVLAIWYQKYFLFYIFDQFFWNSIELSMFNILTYDIKIIFYCCILSKSYSWLVFFIRINRRGITFLWKLFLSLWITWWY